MWWLAPGTENPGYRYGKIAIMPREPAAPADFLIGLYVEKGYGESVVNENLAGHGGMDDHWLWPEFLGSLASGAFTAYADHAQGVAGEPLTLWLDASNWRKGERPVYTPE